RNASRRLEQVERRHVRSAARRGRLGRESCDDDPPALERRRVVVWRRAKGVGASAFHADDLRRWRGVTDRDHDLIRRERRLTGVDVHGDGAEAARTVRRDARPGRAEHQEEGYERPHERLPSATAACAASSTSRSSTTRSPLTSNREGGRAVEWSARAITKASRMSTTPFPSTS